MAKKQLPPPTATFLHINCDSSSVAQFQPSPKEEGYIHVCEGCGVVISFQLHPLVYPSGAYKVQSTGLYQDVWMEVISVHPPRQNEQSIPPSEGVESNTSSGA